MLVHRIRPLFALLLVCIAAPASAQIGGPTVIGGNPPPGVYVEPDGTVKRREVDEKSDLAAMKLRAKLAVDAAKAEKLAYVSLPKAIAAVRAAVDAGKPIPEDLQFLGGLTQIKYVFVYPEDKDIVVAGPAEPFKVVADAYAIGTRTGRPIMRLEDFVVAMRVVRDVRGGAFGCRLDPDPAAPKRISDVMATMARASRPARIKAVQDATGPQKVSFFGAVPADSRFALTTVAADYELKRYGLGLARHQLPGLGTIVDSTRQAVNMIWFELAYQPILVSPEGDAYGLRGPRLAVKAGSFDWDPKGATPKAFEFAKKMSDGMDALATQQPLLAELQNLADLSVVAALIQKDQLAQKVNWNTDWIMARSSESGNGYPVAKVVIPKNADALAAYSNGAIACGGVMLTPAKVVNAPGEREKTETLREPMTQGAQLRKAKADAPVLTP